MAGCHDTPPRTELPREHPAHPLAPAPEYRPGPSPFEQTPTYSVPGAAIPGSAPETGPGHDGHQGDAAPLVYTCPMHPEVIRSEPGECPECGMALRPMAEHADGEGTSGE